MFSMSSQMKLLVIGERGLDKFIRVNCNSIGADVEYPVVKPIKTIQNQGMAANTVLNLEVLGAQVDYYTSTIPIIKTRYVSEKTNHYFLRVDENDDCGGEIGTVDELIKIFNLNHYDAVVISDYNKGFVTEELIQYICDNAKLVFIDTKKILNSNWIIKSDGVSIWTQTVYNNVFVKINEKEYNECCKNSTFAATASCWDNSLIVTLGNRGARYNGRIYPVKDVKNVVDTSGCGDSFMASLTCSMVKDGDIIRAIEFANKKTSETVDKKGITLISL